MTLLKTVDDYKALTPVTATHRLHYGEYDQQFADLYLPQKSKPSLGFPIIVLIHGGCWRAAINLSGLGQLSQSLTELGYAVWNIEYRRLGNGGGFPVTFQDVALATDYLLEIASQYGLNLNRVTCMGHSAGGQLALWLAARHSISTKSILFNDNPLPIHSVVSLAGIPDLDQAANEVICRGAIEELMQGLPDNVLANYKQVSPHHLAPLTIPVQHLIGEEDTVVPCNYMLTYLKKHPNLKQHLSVIPNIGHFEMAMPDTIVWDYIQQALTDNELAMKSAKI